MNQKKGISNHIVGSAIKKCAIKIENIEIKNHGTIDSFIIVVKNNKPKIQVNYLYF